MKVGPIAILAGALLASPLSAQQTGTENTRMLPDISAVGDLFVDLSPDRSSQSSGDRFGIREVELALQAAVDPYFRGDIFIGFSDEEGAALEEAFLTATSLPWMVEGRLGRFRMPVGKQNVTHQHDLHTLEYPHVIQRFFGEEGLAGTGLYAGRIFAPFGFYQELIVTAVDEFGGHAHGAEEEHEEHEGEEHEELEPASSTLGGLGYSARLRNYWDISDAANLELSFSGVTGKKTQERITSLDMVEDLHARQSVIGADLTYRWRPPAEALYRSFIMQVEVMRQLNEVPDGVPPELYFGPVEDVTGGYAFARYQLTRRVHLGARADYVENAGHENGVEEDAGTLKAGSAYLEFFPSEFSKLVAGFERLSPENGDAVNRLVLQATFAIGPHKPHPF